MQQNNRLHEIMEIFFSLIKSIGGLKILIQGFPRKMHLASRAANPSFSNQGNKIHGESESKNPQEYSKGEIKIYKGTATKP